MIRRVLGGNEEKETQWEGEETPQEDPRVEAAPAPADEPEPETEGVGVFVPGGATEVERQAELVRTAMALGGRFGDHEIPVPWLRMTLAGLEGRTIDVDTMWEGIASPPNAEPIEDSMAYQDLFPGQA